MELSKRMNAVSSFVTAGNKIADIGTDHAYIPISLIGEKKIPAALAMDINEGPLQRAREHIEAKNMTDKIELRLSDGMKKLAPKEVQTAIIAGMGGSLMMRIIEDSLETAESLKELILQPQSELAKVRAFLLQQGFVFLDEDMVLDDGKYYSIMKVIFDRTRQAEEWSKPELCFGKHLLLKKHPVLLQFLQREQELKNSILGNLRRQQTERAANRMNEVEDELDCIRKGLAYYAL